MWFNISSALQKAVSLCKINIFSFSSCTYTNFFTNFAPQANHIIGYGKKIH